MMNLRSGRKKHLKKKSGDAIDKVREFLEMN